MKNIDRAQIAEYTLAKYEWLKGDYPEANNTEELIIDLLTDLRHLCKRGWFKHGRLCRYKFKAFFT